MYVGVFAIFRTTIPKTIFMGMEEDSWKIIVKDGDVEKGR